MPYISTWKITLAPGTAAARVLAAVGQQIGEELRFPWAQEVDESRHFRAGARRRYGRGNVSSAMAVQVFDNHADHNTAQEWMLALQIALGTYSQLATTLEVQTQDGTVYVLSNAVLADAEAVMVTAGVARTLTRYKIEGGTWSLGAPAGPDPLGLEAALLSLSRNSGMAEAGGAAPEHLEGIATWANGGTGGDAAQATSGSRPTALVGSGLYLPGVAGNIWSLASHATLAAGNNFALRWDGILPDYTPAARMCLISKWISGAGGRSYALYLEPTGCVTLAVSTDGLATTEWTSTLPVGIPANTFVGIQVIKNLTQLSFLIYPDIGWANGIVFSPQQTISNLTPYVSTTALAVGSIDTGTAALLTGHTVRIQMWTTSAWYADSTLLLVDFAGGAASIAPSVPSSARATANPLRGHYSAGSTLGPGSYPRFDGTDDSIDLAEPIPLNAVSGCTVAWLGQLNRVTGTNDLVFCGTTSTDPRVLLRVDGGDIDLLVRRADAEATATITAAAAVAAYHDGSISASVNFAAGTATIYVNGNPVATGALTSAGTTSATDSSETRIMAGQGGANPAAGDVRHVLILDTAAGPFEMQQWLASMAGGS